MRYSFVAAALLLATTSARPHDQGYPSPSASESHKGHHGDHHPTGIFDKHVGATAGAVKGTGKVHGYGTGTKAGPYAFPTKPAGMEDHGTASNPVETTPDINAALPDQHKDNSLSASGDTKAKADSHDSGCGGVITVTKQNTATVTVAAGAAATGSSGTKPGSKAEVQNQDSPAPAAASSAAPSASSSAAAVSSDSLPQQQQEQPVKAVEADSGSGSGSGSGSNNTPSSSTAPAVVPSATPQNTNTGTTTTPAVTGGNPGKKRGIIASGSGQDALAAAVGNTPNNKIAWLGDWYSGPPKTLPSSLAFVPQMYHIDSDDKGEWTRNVKDAIAGKYGSGPAKNIISFGEPGAGGVSADQAVQAWGQYIEPYAKQGVKAGAPTTLQNTQDFTWLDQFLGKCKGCSISFLCQHWIDKATPLDRQVDAIKGTLNQAKQMGAKYGINEIWLDNFSASGTADEQIAFMNVIVPWLDSQDWIGGYAYAPQGVLTAGAGGDFVDGGATVMNRLGSAYATI